jgi:hypothetical protein
MKVEQLPLSRQVELVFNEIKEELKMVQSGTLFIQIRNNVIGKFGIKHLSLETNNDFQQNFGGMTESQFQLFIQRAIESLKYKRWTHGEIMFDFRVKQNVLQTSVQFESNYNMSNLLKF